MATANQQQRPGAAAPRARRIKVRATRIGYYDLKLIREGDVFTYDLSAEEEQKTRAKRRRNNEPENEGLPSWVERVNEHTPERISGGQEDLNRQHDELRAQRGGGASTGDAEVI